jgi:hypothetical protein
MEDEKIVIENVRVEYISPQKQLSLTMKLVILT